MKDTLITISGNVTHLNQAISSALNKRRTEKNNKCFDRFGMEIKVGDLVRVGIGSTSTFEVVRFTADSVVLLDPQGVEFTPSFKWVSRW